VLLAMRTNIDIDDKILKEAFKLSSAKTKKELVHEALVLLIKIRKRKDLLDLKGKIEFQANYDHKKLRAG
jgi:Arc/MetJ family transcription regulator